MRGAKPKNAPIETTHTYPPGIANENASEHPTTRNKRAKGFYAFVHKFVQV